MKASPTFSVAVDGVGTLECRRRTIRVAAAISAEYNRLVEGAERVAPEFDAIAGVLAFVRVVVTAWPDGFDVYEADPDDEAVWARIYAVYTAVKDAEARFRRSARNESAGASAEPEPVD